MKKKTTFFAILILLFFVLAIPIGIYVNQNNQNQRSTLTEPPIKSTNCLVSNATKLSEANFISLNATNIGDYFIADDSIYYFEEKYNEMAEFSTSATLTQYSIASQNYTKILNLSQSKSISKNQLLQLDMKSDFTPTELKCNGNDIVWSVEYADGSSEIYSMNLDSKAIKSIRKSVDIKTKIPFVLSLDKQYVTWYEGDSQNGFKLLAYNLRNDSIKVFNDVIIESPYVRAHVINDRVTFLQKDVKDVGEVNIVQDNLANGNKMILKTELARSIKNIYGNERFVIWHEDYYNTRIFYYNMESNELSEIKFSPEFTSVFSIDLLNKNLIVNDSKLGTLTIVNLENLKTNYVDGKLYGKGYFYMVKVYNNTLMALYQNKENQVMLFYTSLK